MMNPNSVGLCLRHLRLQRLLSGGLVLCCVLAVVEVVGADDASPGALIQSVEAPALELAPPVVGTSPDSLKPQPLPRMGESSDVSTISEDAVPETHVTLAHVARVEEAADKAAPVEQDDSVAQLQRILDEFVALRQDNTALQATCVALSARNDALSERGRILEGENKLTIFQRDEIAERLASQEVVLTALQQKHTDLATELSLIKVPPPCPWGVLAGGVTGVAKSRLEALCEGTPEVDEAINASKRHLSARPENPSRPREVPLGAQDPALALSLTDVAHALQTAGQYDEAEALFMWAVMILKTGKMKSHLPAATALNNLADLYMGTRDYSKAETALRSALDHYAQELGANDPKLAALENKLAASLRGQGRLEDAEAGYRKAITIYRHALGGDHPQLVAPMHNLAKLYLEMSRYDDAAGVLAMAMKIAYKHAEAKPYVAYLNESVRRLNEARGSATARPEDIVLDKTSGGRPVVGSTVTGNGVE